MSVWVVVELACAALAFPLLFFVPAPYGRHLREGFGPTIDARAGWIVMELPAIVVPVWSYLQAGGGRGDGLALLALWELHYLQRTFVFPLRMRAAGKREPLLVAAAALAFNVLNGHVNGAALARWHADAWALPGVALFVCGLAINVHSDGVLRALRAPGEAGYRIPRRGLFRWVSAANYFGEIVEWTGFALAARTAAALAFAVFTFANLVPRGIVHHRWYREQFPDYPRERKAVLPYLL